MRFIISYCTKENVNTMHEVFGDYFEVQKRVAELSAHLGVDVELMIVESTTRFSPNGDKKAVVEDAEIFE